MYDQDVVGQRNLQRVGAAVLKGGAHDCHRYPERGHVETARVNRRTGSIALGDEDGPGQIAPEGIYR
ncbi:hypothetical protein AB0I85_10885 [Micromonospora echinofusca]|uniref:hypothetical protein n=1 Tax=Micromonospora echinofusca TaxID=47858 RepID=UPI0033DD795F